MKSLLEKPKSEEKSEELMLKANFCRLLFPDLLQFIKSFDIADKDDPANYGNSLHMHFLLDAYTNKVKTSENEDEHNKNVKKSRQACHWKIDKVEEPKVLLAVEEYFFITSEKKSLTKQRNLLLGDMSHENSTYPYKFEDDTTKSILQHFGIPPINKQKGDTLGHQRQSFKNFILSAYNLNNKDADTSSAKELCFDNAFNLLVNLRNWDNHGNMKFNPNQEMLFKRFVLFTHIGITYICRRIWENHSQTLKDSKIGYKEPKSFDFKKEKIEVTIGANDTNLSIYNCTYQINGETQKVADGKMVQFFFEAKKYEPFVIEFMCDNKPYKIYEKTDYYYWTPKLDIIVTPPLKVSYVFEGIAGENQELEAAAGILFSRYKEALDKNTLIATKILRLFNKLSPVFQQQQNIQNIIEIKNKKDEERHEETLNKINDMSDIIGSKMNERFDMFIENLKKNQSSQQNIIDNYFKEIIAKIDDANVITAKNEEMKYKNDRAVFLKKVLFQIILFVGAFAILAISMSNDLSLFWLQYWQWILPIILIVFLLFGFNLWYINETTTNPRLICSNFRRIGIIPYMLSILMVLFAWIIIPNKCTHSLISNYNFFAPHSKVDNITAAKLMEKCLKNGDGSDEEARIKLARYYLYFDNEGDKAYHVIEPMINNPKQYKNGNLIIAETYYDFKDYETVTTILDNMKGIQDPIIDRLRGLMYLYGGHDFNYMLGDSLLRLAADADDAVAQYWMGYLSSNDIRKDLPHYENGEKVYQIPVIKFDLFDAVNYYRKSVNHNYPQAAIGLGILYTELNMNDSAQYYLEKAIELAVNDSISDEAYFRLGIVHERLKIKRDEHLNIVERRYTPAMLHKALKTSDHTTAIRIYQKLGKYQGYRYIHPIVFEYAARNDESKKDLHVALDTLNKSRPNGKFNMAFVESISALLSGDTILSKSLMKLSAEEGCLYAKMFCIFKDLYSFKDNQEMIISSIKNINESLQELAIIGKEIPFANVLISWITKDLGDQNYKLSELYAQIAIRKGHPAGALVFSYAPSMYCDSIDSEISKFITWDGDFTDTYKASWTIDNVIDLLERYNNITMSLRLSLPQWPFRSKNICCGQKIDKVLTTITHGYNEYFTSSQLINKEYPFERLHFWCDLSISTHDFYSEMQIINEYRMMIKKYNDKNIDLQYRKRIMDAVLNDLLWDEKLANNAPDITAVYRFISKELNNMPKDFIDEMAEKHKNNVMALKIINEKNLYGNIGLTGYGIANEEPYFYSFTGDLGLLNEFNDIIERTEDVKIGIAESHSYLNK